MNCFFGTDGIRASIGTSFFTQEHLPIVAHAISSWINSTYAVNAHNPKVLIIHDTRNSCAFIKAIFKMVFLGASIDVVDAGVLPTPAASYLMHQDNYSCAVIISASHNPWHDNGIKIIDRSGKLATDAEKMISHAIKHPTAMPIDYRNLGKEYLCNGVEAYSSILKNFFKKDFLKKIRVVIDCANGSTSAVAHELFSYFGADVITLNNTPTGFNINENCGSTYPQNISQKIIEYNADIGFAFDGDGDRVVAVDNSGSIRNGDDIIALLSTHQDYKNETHIVGTIMSNMGLEQWLMNNNKKFIRTAVGDKYVAQELHNYNALLGGEQSGHILLKNYTNTGDGILVALKVLETLIAQDTMNFKTFTPFPQLLITVPVKKMDDLSKYPYSVLIEQARMNIDNGRISVRYSGTEKNMLRIMVESQEYSNAHDIAHNLAQSLQKELS